MNMKNIKYETYNIPIKVSTCGFDLEIEGRSLKDVINKVEEIIENGEIEMYNEGWSDYPSPSIDYELLKKYGSEL